LTIALSIELDTIEGQDRVWDAGRAIRLAPHEAFWGARFGMRTDKFGIDWMLNCEARQEIHGGRARRLKAAERSYLCVDTFSKPAHPAGLLGRRNLVVSSADPQRVTVRLSRSR
jgi:hypothetical protein